MKKYSIVLAVCASAACSDVESPAPDPHGLDLGRAPPAGNCEDATSEKECGRLERCVWTECPPNADCQLPAWCAARDQPGSSCGSASEYELERRGAEVVIGDAYRACNEDAECMLVSTSCNGCCEQDAIAASLESTYQEKFRAACAGYSGAICDCAFLPAEARCVEHSCTRVLLAR